MDTNSGEYKLQYRYNNYHVIIAYHRKPSTEQFDEWYGWILDSDDTVVDYKVSLVGLEHCIQKTNECISGKYA